MPERARGTMATGIVTGIIGSFIPGVGYAQSAAMQALALGAVGAGGWAWLKQNEAVQQRDNARNSLARIFAERSWQAKERGDYPLAARFALAGWRAAPANEGEYRNALGSILHDANESRALRGHESRVSSAAFSPDGARIVTASWDNTARVWDASRLTELMPELARAACTNFLIPAGRRFSALEIASDPLIREVWLRDHGEDRDVCEGVPDAPALE